MQVRVSPRKPKAKAKEPKKKATKSTKSKSDYPSTNVSSPVRPVAKRNIQDFMYGGDEDDDDYYAEAPHPTGGKTSRGYKDDEFIVPDDSEDDRGFGPVRIAKSLRQAKPKSKLPTAPITIDERVSNLSDMQRDVLRDFMEGAKNMIRDIKMKKGIRNAPFSDTILREMCLDMPRNEAELLAIPGINPEMVQQYGKIFLRLVKHSTQIFGDDPPIPKNMLSKSRRVVEVTEEDEEDEENQELMDPNHVNVIDLCESDEDVEEAVEVESNYSLGDDDDEEDDELHVSHHFDQPADPRVEQFNSRFTQIEAGKPNSRPKTTTVKPAASRAAGAKFGTSKKKGPYRKKGSGSFGRGGSYAGVSKRGSSKTAGSSRKSGSLGRAGSRTAGSGAGAGSRRPPAGGSGGGGGTASGWGPIMAMPT